MIYFMVCKSLLSSTLDLQNHSYNCHYIVECVHYVYFERNKIENCILKKIFEITLFASRIARLHVWLKFFPFLV